MNTDPIKAKIQKPCPDVMELKFGCEVITKAGIKAKIYSDAPKTNLVRLITPQRGIPETTSVGLKEILGSPITLAVVLRAIHASLKGSSKWLDVGMSGQFTGNFFNWEEDEVSFWNLEHDTYDQQSDECKFFIGKLLGV
jgi:hypothetical protein